MQKWGLFGYHYLGKNLACALTILPWLPAHTAQVTWFGPRGIPPFQINEHGLALWFTTPVYLWLLRPRKGWLHGVVLATIVGPVILLLLYQNTGWRQFGYRFSNDYALSSSCSSPSASARSRASSRPPRSGASW